MLNEVTNELKDSNDSLIEIEHSNESINDETNETSMSKEVTLTTFDNPFDPFTEFRKWFMFDIEKGYNTCKILGRIANYSDNFTQKEKDEEIERAIDEFIKHDDLNIYRKVTRIVDDNDFIAS